MREMCRWSSRWGEYKKTHTKCYFGMCFLRVRRSNLERVPSCDVGAIWNTFSHPSTSASANIREIALWWDLDSNVVAHFVIARVHACMCRISLSLKLTELSWGWFPRLPAQLQLTSFRLQDILSAFGELLPFGLLFLSVVNSLTSTQDLKLLLQTIMKPFLKLLETIRQIYFPLRGWICCLTAQGAIVCLITGNSKIN